MKRIVMVVLLACITASAFAEQTDRMKSLLLKRKPVAVSVGGDEVNVLLYVTYDCSTDLDMITTNAWRLGTSGGIVPTNCPADIDNANWVVQRSQNLCTEDDTTPGSYSNCVSLSDISSGNHPEEIVSAANCTSGKGGRGQRHWIGQSVVNTNNSGGVEYVETTDTPITEIFIRWCGRWHSDLNLGGAGDGSPNAFVAEHKVIYFTAGGCNNGGTHCYLDMVYNNWHMGHGTTTDCTGSNGWDGDQMFNGSNAYSDGREIWFEAQFRAQSSPGANDGILRIWIDGVQICENTGANYGGSTGFSRFTFPSNHQYSIMGSGVDGSTVGACLCPSFDRPYDMDDVLVHTGPGPAGPYDSVRGY